MVSIGMPKQDEAGEMELGFLARADSRNGFQCPNRLPHGPRATRALFPHPTLPERAQGRVVERKRGRNLPQMIVVGR
jgi:hypothetical protein